ncbi:phage head closure protein [Bacillus paranthracis]
MLQMKDRITFQQLKEYIDPETDRPVKDWVDIKSVWCAIKTIKGREYISAASTRENVEKTYRFITRYTKDIDDSVKTRIKYKKRIFDMESILNDDEANRTMTIIGVETK